MTGCVKKTTKRYTTRKSPPYPANECQGRAMVGNDGEMYESVPNKKGTGRWLKAVLAPRKKPAAKRVAAKKPAAKRVAAKKPSAKRVAEKKHTNCSSLKVLSEKSHDSETYTSYTIECAFKDQPHGNFIVFVRDGSKKGIFHTVYSDHDEYGPIGGNTPVGHKEGLDWIKKGYSVLVARSIPSQFDN